LGVHLKGLDYGDYLELVEVAAEGVWSQAEDGSFNEDHTHWAGFKNRTALGMEFRHAPAEGP
jgi:hypothetical protein